MNSAQVIANFGDDNFKVVVYDDLDLEFLDHDIQFDEAAHEFGYPETTAMELRKHWKDSPVNIAIGFMTHDENTLNGLILDFVEHVFTIYDTGFKNPRLLTNLIRIGRGFQLHGGRNNPSLMAAIETAKKAEEYSYRDWKEHHSPEEARYAVSCVHCALRVVNIEMNRPAKRYYARQAAENARIARGFQMEQINQGNHNQEGVFWSAFNAFKHEEKCWQIRRFIDIMNAQQSGEDWPPVGATP